MMHPLLTDDLELRLLKPGGIRLWMSDGTQVMSYNMHTSEMSELWPLAKGQPPCGGLFNDPATGGALLGRIPMEELPRRAEEARMIIATTIVNILANGGEGMAPTPPALRLLCCLAACHRLAYLARYADSATDDDCDFTDQARRMAGNVAIYVRRLADFHGHAEAIIQPLREALALAGQPSLSALAQQLGLEAMIAADASPTPCRPVAVRRGAPAL